MNAEFRIDEKKVSKYIDTLTPSEAILMQKALDLARYARQVKARMAESDSKFCETVGIEPKKLRSFLKGSFPYTLRHITNIQSLDMTLSQREFAEKKEKEMVITFEKNE